MLRRFTDVDLGHDEILADIASVVDAADREVLLARVDDAARPLFGAGEAGVVDQAAALERALAHALGPRCVVDDHRALLLHHVLDRRLAHPLVVAAMGHELARRAGLHSAVCRSREGWWTGLVGREGWVLVGSAGSSMPNELGDVRIACAHETAVAVLARLRAQAPPPLDHRADGLLHALLETAARQGHADGA